MAHFSDRLIDAIARTRSAVCVGLDPVLEKLPAPLRALPPVEAIERFCEGVIEAVALTAAAVKVQSACFERYRGEGFSAMWRVIARAKKSGLLVILDAKRGDIGISAQHYAAAAFAGDEGADALTVNPYLGVETLAVMLEGGRGGGAGKGLFVLVRTSNPEGDSLQRARVLTCGGGPNEQDSHSKPMEMPCAGDGESLAERVARDVAQLGSRFVGSRGFSDVGAVVGATKSTESRSLRDRMPQAVFLVPGFGAQGGAADDIRQMARTPYNSISDAGLLVTASRSIIYPEQVSSDWRADIASACSATATEIANVLTRVQSCKNR